MYGLDTLSGVWKLVVVVVRLVWDVSGEVDTRDTFYLR